MAAINTPSVNAITLIENRSVVMGVQSVIQHPVMCPQVSFIGDSLYAEHRLGISTRDLYSRTDRGSNIRFTVDGAPVLKKPSLGRTLWSRAK